MLFDQNRVDAIIHYWKNQVFSNETIQGVPLRHSTSLKPPIGGFRNLASRDGISQSRIISVSLFVVKINSITSCIRNGADQSLFVDDLGVLYRSKQMLAIERQLKLHLNRIED